MGFFALVSLPSKRMHPKFAGGSTTLSDSVGTPIGDGTSLSKG